MSSPYGGHDPETPAGAEAALQSFSDSLEEARLTLKSARDAEVTAKATFREARRKALLSAGCPKVRSTREDGSQVTVAERDAWVEDQAANEEFEYDLAKTARVEAAEHLRTLREQGIIQQSITKSVSQSYGMTRSGERW